LHLVGLISPLEVLKSFLIHQKNWTSPYNDKTLSKVLQQVFSWRL